MSVLVGNSENGNEEGKLHYQYKSARDGLVQVKLLVSISGITLLLHLQNANEKNAKPMRTVRFTLRFHLSPQTFQKTYT